MAVELNKLFDLVVERGASDIHLEVGIPPTIRLNGGLRPLNTPPLTPEDTVSMMKSISPERCQQEIKEKGGSDFGFAYGDKARFRVAIFMQKGCVGMVLRLIPSKMLSFDQLGLPMSVRNLLTRPRGLILVTGPTGSGKTTTLCTMINFINEEMDKHIITVEDPIEYYHVHKRSIIVQREVGVDVPSFSEALRRALRMNPDVILVGELRDLDTIAAAITAAETGHLVFGTLHTTGADKTVNRIVDAFPTEQQEQIRTQLAAGLIAVISQALLPRSDVKGIIAAYEIMIVNGAIQHMIRDNQTHKIISAMQTGGSEGMILLDDFLLELFKQKKINYQSMMFAAQSPIDLEKKIRGELYGESGNGKKK
jgi:twitching motility protein PilT